MKRVILNCFEISMMTLLFIFSRDIHVICFGTRKTGEALPIRFANAADVAQWATLLVCHSLEESVPPIIGFT